MTVDVFEEAGPIAQGSPTWLVQIRGGGSRYDVASQAPNAPTTYVRTFKNLAIAAAYFAALVSRYAEIAP